jgi:hypothetical protein
MPAEEIAALNARLASPPEFDLANSDQLGLFVAARLAQRHGIRVFLRQSPFGGTTAIVLLPLTIIASADDSSWKPGHVSAGGPPPAAADGPAREPAEAGDIGHAARSFGLTGRHRRFGSAQEPGAVPAPRPASPAFESPALDPPAPEPAAVEPPAPMVGEWFSRSQAPGDTAGNDQFGDPPLSGSQFTGTQFSGTGASGSRPGLPKRARGTNLAPQLRAKLSTPAPDAGQPGRPVPAPADGPSARSPEEASILLSALQDGWERARIDDLDDFDGFDGKEYR